MTSWASARLFPLNVMTESAPRWTPRGWMMPSDGEAAEAKPANIRRADRQPVRIRIACPSSVNVLGG